MGGSIPGACESLPQALGASLEGAFLSSKASFVLLLASLHNPFLPSELQTQVLWVVGAPAVSSTEPDTWKVVWHCRGLELASLLPLSPACSELSLSHCPRHLGKPPPPCPGSGCAASGAPIMEEYQKGGQFGCAHPGRHRPELLNWPLTLLLPHREASLAQMTAAPSLTLLVLHPLASPTFPCPGGGAQWKPSPGMEFIKVTSDTASSLPSPPSPLPSPAGLTTWASLSWEVLSCRVS